MAPLPKTLAEGLRAPPPPHPPDPPVSLTLATLAFLLTMFIPGMMSVFYLILFLADFSDLHCRHNETTNLFSRESNILFGIPQ